MKRQKETGLSFRHRPHVFPLSPRQKEGAIRIEVFFHLNFLASRAFSSPFVYRHRDKALFDVGCLKPFMESEFARYKSHTATLPCSFACRAFQTYRAHPSGRLKPRIFATWTNSS